jgi:uncharacterized protein YprB with RNaseH-like and TPR domain
MFSSQFNKRISKLRAEGKLERPVALEPHTVPVNIDEVIQGSELRTTSGTVFLSSRSFSTISREAGLWNKKYVHLGKKLAEDPAGLGTDAAFLAGDRWKRAVFLDLETGGLSGGPVFLAGMLFWDGSGFLLEQLFARDYSEEKALVEELIGCISRFDCVVTYNGKTYDIPFVKDRALYHGLSITFDMPHIDLLHHVRRRWKDRFPDCKLKTLEWHLCNRFRSGDVPGDEIPGVYHRYVREGNPYPLIAIFHHNALDVITMGELVLRLGLEDDADFVKPW